MVMGIGMILLILWEVGKPKMKLRNITRECT